MKQTNAYESVNTKQDAGEFQEAERQVSGKEFKETLNLYTFCVFVSPIETQLI